MNEVVCDASVVLKWFHEEGESEVTESRILLAAHRDGRIGALILDLTVYEIGNALLRSLGRSAQQASEVIEALDEICMTVTPTPGERSLATRLAESHSLTMYDAIYAAVAESRGALLATTDRKLLALRGAHGPADTVTQLGLSNMA